MLDVAAKGPSHAQVNEEGLLTFTVPSGATADEEALASDITSLDLRAHHALRWKTPEWQEVNSLLKNAANAGLVYGDSSQGRELYNRAEAAFRRHLESRNRFIYLLRAIGRIAPAALLALALYFVAMAFTQGFIPRDLLVLMCLFAGIGSVASILTRLNSIDLQMENSNKLIMVSGASKPVVAVCFAIVVYLILDLKIVDIEFGTPGENNANFIYLISSFLSGFSERFAQDILSRVSQ